MERHIERELYYEKENIRTKVNEQGFAWQENVVYNNFI